MPVTTLYRIVRTAVPDVDDFRSNAEKGLAPRFPGPEVLRLWSGISLFDSLDRARQMCRRAPKLGEYIAVLRLPEERLVQFERTTASAGHYTAWGRSVDFLHYVVDVVPA